MVAQPEVVSRSRADGRKAFGVLVGLVLVLGALDLHDPGLSPSVYATPTPVLAGTDCEDHCEHLEAGCLLTPDHQPATRPGGKLRLAFHSVRSAVPPEAVDRHTVPHTPAPAGPPSVRPNSTRSPPAS